MTKCCMCKVYCEERIEFVETFFCKTLSEICYTCFIENFDSVITKCFKNKPRFIYCAYCKLGTTSSCIVVSDVFKNTSKTMCVVCFKCYKENIGL